LPIDEFAVVAIPAIVAVILIVWFGPILIAFLFGLIDITLLVIGVVLIGCWRIVRRRPWAVVASGSDGTLVQWRVVGVRRARRLVRTVAEQLSQGFGPHEIEGQLRTADPAMDVSLDDRDLPDPPLAAQAWREVVKSVGAILASVAIVVGLWLWLRPEKQATVSLRDTSVPTPAHFSRVA
jgi:hypothetical protein